MLNSDQPMILFISDFFFYVLLEKHMTQNMNLKHGKHEWKHDYNIGVI